MADNNKSDIVINAKANTKEAEANLKKLDAQIQGMANSDRAMDKLNGSFKKSGTAVKQAGVDIKGMAGNFNALQGSLGGATTKLGLLGLAIAGVRIAMQQADKAQKEYVENLEKAGKASENLVGSKKGIVDNALTALQNFNELAEKGNLDSNAIQQELLLVEKIREQWGDVGLEVDKTTGKVTGLQTATAQIEQTNQKKILAPLQQQLRAAEEQLKQAQEALAVVESEQQTGVSDAAANWVTTIGNFGNAVKDGLFKWKDPGELFDEYQNKASEGRLTGAKAAVTDAKAEVNRLKSQISDASNNTNPELILKQNADRQAAEATIAKNDVREQQLIRELAAAQMSGGDVAGAKSALDEYLAQRNQARYEELAKLSQSDDTAIAAAQKAYDAAQKSGDGAAIAEAAKALARVTEAAKQHTEEMAKIANGEYKPAVAAQDGLAKGTSNGTFDAFGANGIGHNTVLQQQLDVQKKIAKNTEELAKPVVGE